MRGYECSGLMQLNRIIEEAVLSLPEKCGQVFREKSGGTFVLDQEIAKEMQISVKTVEAQITKALKTIDKEIPW